MAGLTLGQLSAQRRNEGQGTGGGGLTLSSLSAQKGNTLSGGGLTLSSLSAARRSAAQTPSAAVPTEEEKNVGGPWGGIGYAAEKFGLGVLSTIEGVWDYTAGFVADLFGADEWAEERFANDWVDYGHADEWYNPSDGWRMAGDVAGGIGSSIPSLAAYFIPYVGPAVGLGITALGAAGNATKEAYRQTGKLGWEEYGYGALVGGTEAAIEKVGGKLFGTGTEKLAERMVSGTAGLLGSKAAAKVATKTATSVAKEAAETTAKVAGSTFLKQLGKEFVSEGLEEGLAEIVAPVYQRWTYDPDAEDATAEEVFYSAMVGGLSGALMEGFGSGINSAANLLTGHRAVETGSAQGILDTSRQLAAYETANDTGYSSFRNVRELYGQLSQSLTATGGTVTTAKQQMLLGALKRQNTVAKFEPLVERSAMNLLSSAETVAERYRAFGMTDADGNALNVTADGIRSGVDMSLLSSNKKSDRRVFVKQVRRALTENSVLAHLAVADATGHILMDTKKFAQQALEGSRLAERADLNRFIEKASDSQKKALGAQLGIADWNTVTVEEFRTRVGEYAASGGLSDAAAQSRRISAAKKVTKVKNAPQVVTPKRLKNGVHRMTLGEGTGDFALFKEGNTYHLYDYDSGLISREMSIGEVNRTLSTLREAADQAKAAREQQAFTQRVQSIRAGNVGQTQGGLPSQSLRDSSPVGGALGMQATTRETMQAQTVPGMTLAENAKSPVTRMNEENMQVTGEERFALKRDVTGKTYVEVEGSSVKMSDSPSQVVKTLSDIVKTKFTDFVTAGGQKIGINQRAASEWVYSSDAKKLRGTSARSFADKMNAFENADELLQAARDYVGEANKHVRKDNFTEFARGVVTFKVGNRGYDADVIVGTTKSGAALLYDLVNIQQTKIATNEARTAHDRRSTSQAATNSIPQNGAVVNPAGEKTFGRVQAQPQVQPQVQPQAQQQGADGVSAKARELMQAAKERTAAEAVDAYAREHVEDYHRLSAPAQQSVRATIRQAQAHGLSDTEVATYARVAARSGLEIVFEPSGTVTGDAMLAGNTVYVDPKAPAERRRSRLLLHETWHAATRTAEGQRAVAKVAEAAGRTDPEMAARIRAQYTAHYNGTGISEAQLETIVREEISARRMEDALGDAEVWDYILRETPSMGERWLSLLRGSAQAYTADPAMSREARRLLRTYKKLFDGLAARNQGNQAVDSSAGGARNALKNEETPLQNAPNDGTIEQEQNHRQGGVKDGEVATGSGENDQGRAARVAAREYEGSSTQKRHGSRISEKVGRNDEGVQSTIQSLRTRLREVKRQKKRFSESSYVVPTKGSAEDRICKEIAAYDLEAYIVKRSSWDTAAEAFTNSGRIYVMEGLSADATTLVVPHEITHVMRTLDYAPYADFLDRVPTMLNMASEATRNLLSGREEHCRVDVFDGDAVDIGRVYDEINASLYGEYARGISDEDFLAWVRGAFYDFDAYITELAEIHEQFKRDMSHARDEFDVRHALPDDGAPTKTTEGFDAEAAVKRGAPRTKGRTSMTVAQLKETVANNTRMKVYSRKSAMRIVSRFTDVSLLTEKSRVQLYDAVWQGMNDCTGIEEKQRFARSMAEFTVGKLLTEAKVENPAVQDAYEKLIYLRDGLGRITFSDEQKSELRHVLDRDGALAVTKRWSYARSKKKIYPMDIFVHDVATEMPGMEYLEDMHPVDAFLEINEVYEKARRTVRDRWLSAYDDVGDAEIEGMIADVEQTVMQAFTDEGEASHFAQLLESKMEAVNRRADYWKAEYGRIKGWDHAAGLCTAQAQKMKELKLHTFTNATEHQSDLFKSSIERLSRVQYRGNLSVTATRNAVKDLLTWYTKENPVLGYVSEEQTGYYRQGIADMMKELAEGDKKFTAEDLRTLHDVMAYFTRFVETWGKVYRAGRWMDAKPEAERYVSRLRETQGAAPTAFRRIMGTRLVGKYAETFAEPMVLARYMDGYEDGFYTEMMQDVRDAAVDAEVAEMEIKAAYDEFMGKNKHYVEQASAETVRYAGVDMSRMQLMGLYMTMKRDHAHAGLAISGFAFRNAKGETVRVDGFLRQDTGQGEIRTGIEGQLTEIRHLLRDVDMTYIGILEKVYNEDARRLKADRDIQRLGFTNATNDYYYPIRRGNVAKNIDTDMAAELDRVTNSSFNKDTVQGARQELFIESADTLFHRHVHAVVQYAYLSPAVEAYNILYNMDVSGNKNKPVSVATEGANVWADGNRYFAKLIADVQGVSPTSGEGNAILGRIRSGYAKYQLGANLKVWFTQLSSLAASTSLLDADAVARGFVMRSPGLDDYCSLAKLRNYDGTAARAQSVADTRGKRAVRKLDRFGDALMKPIGWTDRFVVGRLFGACQVQVEKDGGAQVGTEENRVEAGKLLRRVILETQQNAVATERSAAMRSSNEILRTLTMFSADSMKVLGRVIDAVGEHDAVKARLRAARGADSGLPAADGRASTPTAATKIRAGMTDAERATVLRGQKITPTEIRVDEGFDVDFEYLEKNRKSAVEKPLIEKLRELGYLTRYKTDTVDVEFDFTAGGLRKSMNSQVSDYGGTLGDLAKVVMNMQGLLDSAVLLEVHADKAKGTPRENKRLVQTYVMLSAFREGNTVTPVQFEVKQYVDDNNRLYLAVAMTKIETGVMGDTALQGGGRTRLLPVSDISIPQLIQKINPRDENFFKYAPNEFLTAQQKAAKRRALDKEDKKYGRVNTQSVEALEARLKEANRQVGRSVAALLLTSAMMAGIARGFRWLYDKEDEEEWKATTVDFIGNLFGGLPLIRDVYSRLAEGYELDNYAYSAVNDLLNSAVSVFDAAGSIFTDKEKSAEDMARGIRSMVNAVGQLFGVPTRNVYNAVYGLTKRFGPASAAYEMDGVFYQKNYKNDLERALEDGDGELASYILGLLYNERLGTNVSQPVHDELYRLASAGHKVLPRAVADTVTIDGVEMELPTDLQEALRGEYAKVQGELEKLMSRADYAALSDESRAEAINYLYDLCYAAAKEQVLGIDGGAAVTLAGVVSTGTLAMLHLSTKGIAGDKDARGETVAGSKRKKVVAAIRRMNISTDQKLLLICAKGYSLQDGDIPGLSAALAKRKLLSYLMKLRVSKEKKAELAEMCGFEVVNGRVKASSVGSLAGFKVVK